MKIKNFKDLSDNIYILDNHKEVILTKSSQESTNIKTE